MTINLVIGAVSGGFVLVLFLLGLGARVETVVFPNSRVVDPLREHIPGADFGFYFAGSLLGLLMLTLHPGPIMEKLGAAGFVAASLGGLGDVVKWLRRRRHLGPRLMSVRAPVG
jgi:hypothetical protein